MKVYKLPYVIFAPGEGENDEDDKYVAEIPDLPGCRAWGDTAEQAVEYLRGNAVAFIESYISRGDALPPQVDALVLEEDPRASQLLVAV